MSWLSQWVSLTLCAFPLMTIRGLQHSWEFTDIMRLMSWSHLSWDDLNAFNTLSWISTSALFSLCVESLWGERDTIGVSAQKARCSPVEILNRTHGTSTLLLNKHIRHNIQSVSTSWKHIIYTLVNCSVPVCWCFNSSCATPAVRGRYTLFTLELT